MKQYKLKKRYVLQSGEVLEPQILKQSTPFGKLTDYYATLEDEHEDENKIILKSNFVETNIEFFEEIKEERILKYPNGALMGIEGKRQKIFRVILEQELYTKYGLLFEDSDCIDYETYSVVEEYTSPSTSFISQNCFLTKEEAIKEIEMRNVQDKLLRKIAEIDRDWNGEGKKCCLYYYHTDKICMTSCNKTYTPNTSMSEKAKDYMFSDEVSEKERRLFLGIKDI